MMEMLKVIVMVIGDGEGHGDVMVDGDGYW